jgi:hypothetical protein
VNVFRRVVSISVLIQIRSTLKVTLKVTILNSLSSLLASTVYTVSKCKYCEAKQLLKRNG